MIHLKTSIHNQFLMQSENSNKTFALQESFLSPLFCPENVFSCIKINVFFMKYE